MNNQEYEMLCGYTIGLLKYKPHLFAEDVVNDVLLQCIENNEPLSLDLLKKRISQYLILNTHHHDDLRGNVKFCDEETSKYCKICKEDKPIAAFSIVERTKYKSKEIFHCCKECQAATMRAYYQTTEWKKKRLYYLVNSSLNDENKVVPPRINSIALLNYKDYSNYLDKFANLIDSGTAESGTQNH